MLLDCETTNLSACRNSTSNRYTQAPEQSEADLPQSEPQGEDGYFVIRVILLAVKKESDGMAFSCSGKEMKQTSRRQNWKSTWSARIAWLFHRARRGRVLSLVAVSKSSSVEPLASWCVDERRAMLRRTGRFQPCLISGLSRLDARDWRR